MFAGKMSLIEQSSYVFWLLLDFEEMKRISDETFLNTIVCFQSCSNSQRRYNFSIVLDQQHLDISQELINRISNDHKHLLGTSITYYALKMSNVDRQARSSSVHNLDAKHPTNWHRDNMFMFSTKDDQLNSQWIY